MFLLGCSEKNSFAWSRAGRTQGPHLTRKSHFQQQVGWGTRLGRAGQKTNFWERGMGSNSAEPGRGSKSAGWGGAMEKPSRSGAWQKEREPIKK